MVDLFLREGFDVAASVRQQLQLDMKRVPGLRMLEGAFMTIRQAMATPRGREAGARYLAAFVEDMKASGFVARSLERNCVEGAAIAPVESIRSA